MTAALTCSILSLISCRILCFLVSGVLGFRRRFLLGRFLGFTFTAKNIQKHRQLNNNAALIIAHVKRWREKFQKSRWLTLGFVVGYRPILWTRPSFGGRKWTWWRPAGGGTSAGAEVSPCCSSCPLSSSSSPLSSSSSLKNQAFPPLCCPTVRDTAWRHKGNL